MELIDIYPHIVATIILTVINTTLTVREGRSASSFLLSLVTSILFSFGGGITASILATGSYTWKTPVISVTLITAVIVFSLNIRRQLTPKQILFVSRYIVLPAFFIPGLIVGMRYYPLPLAVAHALITSYLGGAFRLRLLQGVKKLKNK